MLTSTLADLDIFNSRDIQGNELDYDNLESDLTDLEESDTSADEYDTDGDQESQLEAGTEVNTIAEGSEGAQSTLEHKIGRALAFFDQISLRVEDFLDGLSWGDEACTRNAKIRNERTLLLQSPKLLGILQRWATPPQPEKGKKKRPTGASAMITNFTLEHIRHQLQDELENVAPNLKSPPSVDVEEATLHETTFAELSSCMHTEAPTVWTLLQSLSSTTRTRRKKTEKVSLTLGIFVDIR